MLDNETVTMLIEMFPVEGNDLTVSEIRELALQIQKRSHILPASADVERRRNIVVLDIDRQRTFCDPTGALYVAGGRGALEDTKNLIHGLIPVLDQISLFIPTMDTHNPYQLSHVVAHRRPDGSFPDPGTIVTLDDYLAGRLVANADMAAQLGTTQKWLNAQHIFALEQLTANDRYDLMLWPEHGILGGAEHQLMPGINQLRLFHAYLRGAANVPVMKGAIPLTEQYSALRPEVQLMVDSHGDKTNPKKIPGAELNHDLFNQLISADMVLIPGEAGSHCVSWTGRDLLELLYPLEPQLCEKVYFLEDCISPVNLPDGTDFSKNQEEAFNLFRNFGAHVVQANTPMASWAGIAQQLA